jgi:hypothetical protein
MYTEVAIANNNEMLPRTNIQFIFKRSENVNTQNKPVLNPSVEEHSHNRRYERSDDTTLHALFLVFPPSEG